MTVKLAGKEIYLRPLEDRDAPALLHVHETNREFWQQYTPTRPSEFYTLGYQVQRIQTSLELRAKDMQYDYGIFHSNQDELIGVVSLTEVVRSTLQSCWIGYYLDASHNGHGYMSTAVRMVVEEAFSVLKLHRIEAGVMPHNRGSARVLEKVGFHCEGLAKSNVKINGKWEDHLHFAMVNSSDV